jgi:RNA 3'-terminal phosphate cyclase (ATP)
MIELDGAEQSGSGTVVRYAVALAALLGQPLHVRNVRAKRPKPGLRAQHLTAVQACAALCGGKAEGLAVGASEFVFTPGRHIRGGRFAWDIGTAGSTTMLAFGILPLAAFADGPIEARVTGGVYQDFAPSPDHFQQVLAPVLARMGLAVSLDVVRAGYYPRGAGVVELRVEPVAARLSPVALEERGEVQEVRGVAFASHLAGRGVSERLAQSCERTLRAGGLACRIERVEDAAALHPGAGLAVWAATSTGCRLGADRAGAPGRSSEEIGRSVAGALLEDLASGATVDRHAADMLVMFAALARGTSRYRAPRATDHLATNLWLVERFGAHAAHHGGSVEVDGIGIARQA